MQLNSSHFYYVSKTKHLSDFSFDSLILLTFSCRVAVKDFCQMLDLHRDQKPHDMRTIET